MLNNPNYIGLDWNVCVNNGIQNTTFFITSLAERLEINITRVYFVSSITLRLNLVLQHYYCVVIGQSHLLIHVYGDTRSTHYQNFQVFLRGHHLPPDF